MTDDIDNINTPKPLNSGTCPICGMWAKGFVKCPWCNGKRNASKKPRRWVGGVEIP